MVLGITVQQSKLLEFSTLFLVTKSLLQNSQALNVVKAYQDKLAQLRATSIIHGITEVRPNAVSGSIHVLHKYRVSYTIVGELYIAVISFSSSNPFSDIEYLNKAKKVLSTTAGGNSSVVASKFAASKAYAETMFALQRVLENESGADVVKYAKFLDISPHCQSPVPDEEELKAKWRANVASLEEKDKTIMELSNVNVKIPVDIFSTKSSSRAGKSDAYPTPRKRLKLEISQNAKILDVARRPRSFSADMRASSGNPTNQLTLASPRSSAPSPSRALSSGGDANQSPQVTKLMTNQISSGSVGRASGKKVSRPVLHISQFEPR